MSLFGGVDKTGPKGERLPKFTEGDYTLRVIENKVINTQDGDAMLRAFKIEDSVGEKALPKGTEAAAKLLYFGDKWVDDRIAEYVVGLTNAEKATSELCEKIFGPENPSKDKLIKVRVYNAKNQKGVDYLRYDWRYVADDDE